MLRVLKAMDPALRQYEIQLSQPNATLVKRVTWFCALGDFAFIAWSVGNAILHSPHQPLIDALFVPVVLATVLILVSFIPSHPKMTVTIGYDFIESRMRGAWFPYKKRIRRSDIKLLSENRRGLRIMDRGKFGSIMLGFIFIPATMPEYQKIKSELASWAPIKVKS
jgi:hypothetical protein